MSGVNFERAHSDSERETTFYQSVMLCYVSHHARGRTASLLSRSSVSYGSTVLKHFFALCRVKKYDNQINKLNASLPCSM